MKQKTYLLLCLLLFLFILFCMNRKKIENFELGNNIYTEICRDDPLWRKDNKTCLYYSLKDSNCLDVGDNGKTAFESCLVACDNCNIGKIETPSIEAYDEIHDEHTDYSPLGDNDRTDIRYIYNQIDELNKKIDNLL